MFGGAQLLQTLQRKLDELDDSVVADQRMVRAREAWRACMKTATGEEHEDSESIEEGITERFEQIVGSVVPPGQVAAAGTQVDAAALRSSSRTRSTLHASRRRVREEAHRGDRAEGPARRRRSKFRAENAELLRTVKPLGT